MLKPLCKILFFFLFIPYVYGVGPKDFSWSGNLYKKIKAYNDLHQTFFKQVCTPGTEFKYHKLLRSYRGQGNFLPLLGDDIDRQSIQKNLYHFKAKIRYIDSLVSKLKKEKSLPKFNFISKDLLQTINDLLKLKKNYYSEIVQTKKLKILQESDQKLKLMIKQYDNLLANLYFLKSYRFPNNHLQNRIEYEKYKDFQDIKNSHKANQIFFYRKIVEDGTYNSKHQRSDLYTRSTLDTLYFKIRKQKHFIDEVVRYDLEWTLKNIAIFISEGYKSQLARLTEWKKRTQESYRFYRDIIKQKNSQKAHELVKERNEASIALKQFVYSKQAETYHFWHKQDPLLKALFSMETILYNEVGVIDGEDALERKDVAQIVMNRYLDDFYSSLDPKQELVKYLSVEKDDYRHERWLNTLFRVGEFSFTYHYIAGVAKIFCPDMSRRGKSVRDKNLKISLKALKSFNPDYKALRYFSRVSMLGKIDMTSVWPDYIKVAEKPGDEVVRQHKLERLFYADKYQFLYNFQDAKGISYQVISIDDTTYAMTWIRGRPRFYAYRNPHLFTYFQKK